jgi:hypothetical protein
MELPSNLDIARVFESLQGEVKAEAADEATRIGGAWVSSGATSWMSKALGVGVGGDVTPETLDAIEGFFTARGVQSRIEVTSFAPVPLLELLAERGYGLVLVGSVFARGLADMTEIEEGPATVRRGPTKGATVERLAPDDEASLNEAMSVVCGGFVPDGGVLSANDVATAVRVASLPGTSTVVARAKSVIVGAGSVTVRHGVANLYGSSVLHAHRRKGLHNALMIERLRMAAELGATLALIVSTPGAPTERNALRLGFVPSYTRLVLVRR